MACQFSYSSWTVPEADRGVPEKETLKGALADYIVDELVIEHVSQKHPDEMSKRAYEYYRRLFCDYCGKTDSSDK